MKEKRLGFLYKAAAILTQTQNKSYDILRSHYLMRCPELLSSKRSSSDYLSKDRCAYCCLEWKKDAQLMIKATKLSRRQKKRMKSKKISPLHSSKQVERRCSMCGHTSAVHLVLLSDKIKTDSKVLVKPKTIKKKFEKKEDKVKSLNVYTHISEVFSMKNENKVTPDLVPVKLKNNKKKKDRFAGLCQKAVLDAAKRKEESEKKNKLNLFLKPTS